MLKIASVTSNFANCMEVDLDVYTSLFAVNRRTEEKQKKKSLVN